MFKRFQKFTLVFLLVLSGFAVSFISSQPNDPESIKRILSEVKTIAEHPQLTNGVFAFSLQKASGEGVVAYNSDKSLIPASTLKLLTTQTALDLLGKDFRFETKLQYDGKINSGVLDGNLIIRGGGDPTLGSDLFMAKGDSTIVERFVKALQKANIKEITGKVIGDASLYPENTIPTNWIWEDIGNYYGASPSGLTFNENKYNLVLRSGSKEGDSAVIIKTEPSLNIQFVNRVVAGGRGDNAFIYGVPYSSIRIVEGTIPPGKQEFTIKGSLPDPALLLAEQLHDALKKAGVKINKKPVSSFTSTLSKELLQKERKDIFTLKSPSLEKIISVTNHKSHNLFAEHLLLAIGFKASGVASIQTGVDAIITYLKSNSIDTKGMYLTDGSGLSRINNLTAEQLTALLLVASKQKDFNAFYSSLPEHSHPKIKAKSGYMTRVRSYTGYITSKKGDKYVFSMIANNFEGTPSEMRKRMEKLMLLCYEVL